jgi:hypothetical protein
VPDVEASLLALHAPEGLGLGLEPARDTVPAR